MNTIRIPRVFYDDHVARDLPEGRIVRTLAREYVIEIDDVALADLIGDARYYADMAHLGGLDPTYHGLAASARATLRRLEATR